MENFDIALKFTTERNNFPETRWHNLYEFDILLDEDNEFGTKIGKGVVYLYQLRKMWHEGLDGMSIFGIFDENYHDDIFQEIFEFDEFGTIDVRERYYMCLDIPGIVLNILIPDRVEILPTYRGKGYGNTVMKLIQDHFDGCYGLEMFTTAPLQLAGANYWGYEFMKEMRYDMLDQNEQTAQASVDKIFTKYGYTQVDDSNIFFTIPD